VTRVRAALLVLLATVLGGCATAGGPDADTVASSTLDDVTEHWSRFGGQVRTGEDLAASAVERSSASPGYESVQVEALDWSGTTGSDDGATVVLRVTAHVEARDSTAIFESDVPESDAVVCTRFVLGAGRDRHAVEEEPVSCPDGAQARTPRPAREPEVPGDTEARLVTVLGRTDPASLQGDVERALAGDDVTVSTGSDRDEDGRPRLVAAVGVPGGTDCVVVVRRGADRPARVGGFPREWLQPGEVGCSAALVLSPPL
jgi:hypothetical protein